MNNCYYSYFYYSPCFPLFSDPNAQSSAGAENPGAASRSHAPSERRVGRRAEGPGAGEPEEHVQAAGGPPRRSGRPQPSQQNGENGAGARRQTCKSLLPLGTLPFAPCKHLRSALFQVEVGQLRDRLSQASSAVTHGASGSEANLRLELTSSQVDAAQIRSELDRARKDKQITSGLVTQLQRDMANKVRNGEAQTEGLINSC